MSGDLKARLVIEGDASGAQAAVDGVDTALDGLGRSGKVAGDGLESAFAATGVRSANAIRAEILEINQALIRIASSGRTSGAEFDRAFASAQARIAALNRELAGTGNTGANAMNQVTRGADGAVAALKPMAGAIAAAFATDRIARAAVEMDSLKRSLTAITGSSDKAAAEMQYLSQTAARLGLEVGSAGKAYASFSAATKGTALEGQASREVFEAVAGSMARLGKSSADTEGALLALSQMVSKGTVSMEELRGQLGERLPGAFKIAADSMGLTERQLIDLVESGGLLAVDLLPRLAEGLKKVYDTGGEVDSLIGHWNRFQNAITEAAGKLTETTAGVTGLQAALGLLREGALAVGTGVITVFEGLALAAKSGAAAVAVLTGVLSAREGWDEIKKAASESAERINALASQMGTAKLVATQLGTAVGEAGTKAREGAEGMAQMGTSAAAISVAMKQIVAAWDEYDKKARQIIELDRLRAQNAAALIELAADEVAAADQLARAASHEAAALGKLAEAKAAEAVAARSLFEPKRQEAEERAKAVEALEANIESLEKASEAERSAIARAKDLAEAARKSAAEAEKLAEAKELEAEKPRLAADAATLAADKQALAAATLRDNSARVQELKAAYEAATATLAQYTKLHAEGLVTDEEFARVQREQVAALALYRDALADAAQALAAKEEATRRQTDLASKAVQVDIEAARAAQAAARARGDEVTAIRESVTVQELEAKQAGVVAEGKRREAEAAREAAAAKIEEIKASGEMTPAKAEEIAAINDAVKARELEAAASAEAAKQARAEADEAERSAREKIKQATASKAAGEETKKAGEAARAAALDTAALAREMGLGAEHTERFTAKLHELIAKAAQAGNVSLEVIGEAQRAAADYARAMAHIDNLTARIGEAAQAGSGDLARLVAEGEAAAQVGEQIGEEDLAGLRSALSAARSQMESLKDSAEDTLSSLQQELAQLNGNYAEAERLRFAARRADLEAQLALARAQGNVEAASALSRSLSVLDQVAAKKIDEARQREQEDRSATPAGSGSRSAASSGDDAFSAATRGGTGRGGSGRAVAGGPSSAPPVAPSSTHRVEIKLPTGGTRQVQTASEQSSRELVGVLRELSAAAERAATNG